MNTQHTKIINQLSNFHPDQGILQDHDRTGSLGNSGMSLMLSTSSHCRPNLFKETLSSKQIETARPQGHEFSSHLAMQRWLSSPAQQDPWSTRVPPSSTSRTEAAADVTRRFEFQYYLNREAEFPVQKVSDGEKRLPAPAPPPPSPVPAEEQEPKSMPQVAPAA